MEQRDFFQDVYDVVRLIPHGRVSSYGAIARYLGSARGARVVGYAMNAAHQQEKWVPAHRVLNKVGLLINLSSRITAINSYRSSSDKVTGCGR